MLPENNVPPYTEVPVTVVAVMDVPLNVADSILVERTLVILPVVPVIVAILPVPIHPVVNAPVVPLNELDRMLFADTLVNTPDVPLNVAELVVLNVPVPDIFKLLTKGESTRLTIGEVPVPPVIILVPGCTLVISLPSANLCITTPSSVEPEKIVPPDNVVAE